MKSDKPKTTTDNEIVQRRFGIEHEKPCIDPNAIECALYACQEANECQHWRKMT